MRSRNPIMLLFYMSCGPNSKWPPKSKMAPIKSSYHIFAPNWHRFALFWCKYGFFKVKEFNYVIIFHVIWRIFKMASKIQDGCLKIKVICGTTQPNSREPKVRVTHTIFRINMGFWGQGTQLCYCFTCHVAPIYILYRSKFKMAQNT